MMIERSGRALPRRTLLIVLLMLAAPGVDSGAARMPQYLSVPSFQMCLGEKDQGSYKVWCMPSKKPEFCPDDSWKQLQELPEGQRLTPC